MFRINREDRERDPVEHNICHFLNESLYDSYELVKTSLCLMLKKQVALFKFIEFV